MAQLQPETIYLKKNNEFSSDDVEQAGTVLNRGGIIALPTDTIYGVACLAQSSEGVRKLYELKQRDAKKPLAICVGDIEEINSWSFAPNEALLCDLLPGAVTVVLLRRPELNPELNSGLTSVGVRIPSHPFVRRLAQFCKQPLALTSANTSNKPSTIAVEEFKELWSKLDLLVDGGTLSDCSRLGSTVVDISQPSTFRIIRPGSAYEKTRQVLGLKHGLQEISSD